jgi:hypothetical protein
MLKGSKAKVTMGFSRGRSRRKSTKERMGKMSQVMASIVR